MIIRNAFCGNKILFRARKAMIAQVMISNCSLDSVLALENYWYSNLGEFIASKHTTADSAPQLPQEL